MTKKLSWVLLVFLLINFSSAITASSVSYSLDLFGNGVVSGDGDFTYVSEPRATSGNAQSSSFSANIGLFDSSTYISTVTISSYSISPKTATIGSTISLTLSASNYESLWVKIISPNSQESTLNLINGQSVNYLPIPSLIGTYQVIFYANNSNGAIATVTDSFELTAVPPSSPGSSGASGGGGGGSSGSTITCSYNWDCTPWSLCSNNLQTRVCNNIGTCVGVQGKPREQVECSEALFDVLLNLNGLKTDDGSLIFDINLTELLSDDKIDVHIKYSIINSEGYEIFSQIETRAVGDEIFYNKIIDDLNLENGKYILRVDVLYGNLQRAFAEQSFELSSENLDGKITGLVGEDQGVGFEINPLLISFFVGLFVLAVLFYYLFRHRHSKLSNRVTEIIGLEVYTDSGLKIGRVYDISIKDNQIYGLKIVVDSSVNIGYPKVLIKYEYVQNIKHAVIVSSHVLDSSNIK